MTTLLGTLLVCTYRYHNVRVRMRSMIKALWNFFQKMFKNLFYWYGLSEEQIQGVYLRKLTRRGYFRASWESPKDVVVN